jgi:hypothetical protein
VRDAIHALGNTGHTAKDIGAQMVRDGAGENSELKLQKYFAGMIQRVKMHFTTGSDGTVLYTSTELDGRTVAASPPTDQPAAANSMPAIEPVDNPFDSEEALVAFVAAEKASRGGGCPEQVNLESAAMAAAAALEKSAVVLEVPASPAPAQKAATAPAEAPADNTGTLPQRLIRNIQAKPGFHDIESLTKECGRPFDPVSRELTKLVQQKIICKIDGKWWTAEDAIERVNSLPVNPPPVVQKLAEVVEVPAIAAPDQEVATDLEEPPSDASTADLTRYHLSRGLHDVLEIAEACNRPSESVYIELAKLEEQGAVHHDTRRGGWYEVPSSPSPAREEPTDPSIVARIRAVITGEFKNGSELAALADVPVWTVSGAMEELMRHDPGIIRKLIGDRYHFAVRIPVAKEDAVWL